VTNPPLAPEGFIPEGNFKTFAQLTLPAGTFVVSTHALLDNNDRNLLATVACQVDGAVGTRTDVTAFQSTTLAFTSAITLGAAGPVRLTCAEQSRSASNTNIFLTRAVMNAIQVGKLTTQ